MGTEIVGAYSWDEMAEGVAGAEIVGGAYGHYVGAPVPPMPPMVLPPPPMPPHPQAPPAHHAHYQQAVAQHNHMAAMQNHRLIAENRMMMQRMHEAQLSASPYAPNGQLGPRAPGAAYATMGGRSMAPHVAVRKEETLREYPLGFYQAAVAASAVAIVTSRPQVLFRGERLVIAASVSANFLIIDLKVGKNSQLANSNQIPAEVFDQTSVGVRLHFDTAVVAQDIDLIVQNSDSVDAHDFKAAILGTAVE